MPRPDARQKLGATKQPGSGPSKLLIGAIILALALIAGVALVVKMELDKQEVASSTAPKGSGDAQVVVAEDASAVTAYPGAAKAGAPTVDIYSDPQCPFCGKFEQQYGEMLNAKAKEGAVKVVYHPKTFLDGNIPDKNSERAVGALLCSVPANRFLELQQAMFAAQPEEGAGYPDATLKTLGGTAGISGDAKKTYDECVDKGTYRKFALKLENFSKGKKYTDLEGKQQTGIRSTPSVFINDKLFDLSQINSNPSSLELALTEAATGEAKTLLQKGATPAPSAPATSAPATSGAATSAPAGTAPKTAAPTTSK